jgi:glycosyltransferase involved in cell wall biosynthesis
MEIPKELRAPVSETHFRVVYLDHVARFSGGEIALTRLLAASREFVNAHVILAEDGPLVERLRQAGATVEVMPMAEHLRNVRKGEVSPGRIPWRHALAFADYVITIRRRLRELRPDLVHTNSLKAAVYGGLAGRLAGIPVVWHIRDRIADDYLPRPAVVLIRLMSRFIPTRIVTNSASTLSTLPFTHRADVLYNAVVPAGSQPDDRRGKDPGGPLTVGVVGRIAPWKGQDVFLRAFAEAFPDGPERARIIGSAMFGEEDFEREIRALADALGIADRVDWVGFSDDVDGELAWLDMLVHSSVTPEPFGQVVVEGMAAGLPVIATAAGGPVEIVDDGEDGLLTPPGDTGALAVALRKLAGDSDLRQAMGARARASAARFNPTSASTDLIAIYRRTLGRTTLRRGQFT